ncbi:MAG: Macrolide export ATP-binding/permease protein MacB [Calditrichaeota bacterium]|nr:Macrolide export ATP-binding/permease protein MacB [Calditrichota bacterium]
MNIAEALRVSVASISGSKLRSALTLLGVVIGVLTIIATMSVIRGLNNLVEQEMSQLSAGVFQVQRYDAQINLGPPDHDRRYRPKIGMREVLAIREHAPLTEIVAPEVWNWGAVVKYKNNATNPNITILGGTPGSMPNNGYNIARGRSLTEQDVRYARPVVILGSAIVKQLFPYRDPLEEEVSVNGKRALVIGIFEEMGSMLNQQADYRVAVPLTTFETWWGTERSWNITVSVRDPERMDEAVQQTIAAVRVARGLKPGEENNFATWSSEQLVDSFNDMTRWIKIAAFGIAAIALLVAGVGIMNIMLVTVTERTREIGVRKAIGARRTSILSQFLLEAVILTEIGGVIGVGLGITTAFLLGQSINLPIAIPAWSIVLGLAFCSLIGLGFGTWPAWKASRLDPIEALRYE